MLVDQCWLNCVGGTVLVKCFWWNRVLELCFWNYVGETILVEWF